MKHLLVLLLTASGAAFAQTTGTVNPSPPAESSKKEDVPPGDCMPIGMTVSGEIVFPIQCTEIIGRIIERQLRQAAEQEKPAAKQSETVAPENSKPAIKPSETVPRPKSRERAKSPGGGYDCQHYRTYDPASGTYTGYDGRRRSCP